MHLNALAVLLKTIADFRPKWSKSIPVFRQNGLKTVPFGAAHNYMAHIGEYLPFDGGAAQKK